MSELVQAMVHTISRFVMMFFNLQIDSGVTVGGFLVAVAILGAVIRLIFLFVNVPGSAWINGRYVDGRENIKFKDSSRIESKK